MERLITTILLCISLSSHATDLGQIYNVIKHVETNNRELAVGDNGKAYGVVQIHKICVDDINRIYKTSYTHQDAFDKTCSREMFMLYIAAGVKRFKRKYDKDPTEGQIVRMWNGSIYNGYNKRSTVKYYKRYLSYKQKYEQRRFKTN